MNRATRTFLRLAVHLVHLVSSLMGDDIAGKRVRRLALRAMGARIGHRSFLNGGGYFSWPAHLRVGDHVFVNRNCYFDLETTVTLSDNSQVGHGASFITTTHEVGPSTRRCGAHSAQPIHVGEGAWIGANVMVLSGVTIGAGAIVAAAALVTKDVAPNTLVAGVPARFVRALPLAGEERARRPTVEGAPATEADQDHEAAAGRNGACVVDIDGPRRNRESRRA